GLGFAGGVNYIWRRYSNFQFFDTLGLQPSDFTAVSFTPAAATCPAGARCSTVTYYVPNFQVPTITNLTNYSRYQYNRTFHGIDVSGRKRLSNHWLMNTSYSYNSTIVNNGFGGAFANTIPEDPTNLALRNGYQYDYLTSGSGLGNVYVNTKWLFKISGMYEAP